MTRKLWLAAVLAASVAFPAIAEDASTKVAPEAARSGTPFTMEDARKHLMQQGYTNVSELVKDASGKWVGSAMKDGKTVPGAVSARSATTK